MKPLRNRKNIPKVTAKKDEKNLKKAGGKTKRNWKGKSQIITEVPVTIAPYVIDEEGTPTKKACEGDKTEKGIDQFSTPENEEFQISSPASSLGLGMDLQHNGPKYRLLRNALFNEDESLQRANRHRHGYLNFQKEIDASMPSPDLRKLGFHDNPFIGNSTETLTGQCSSSSTPSRQPLQAMYHSQPSYMTNQMNQKRAVAQSRKDTVQNRSETIDSRWDPLGFAEKNLFDSSRGVPLSRAQCEENILKLTRNSREVDYYPYLELAQTFHNKDSRMQQLALGMAFNTIWNNTLTQKLKKTATSGITSEVQPNIGFSLKNARLDEEDIQLPSRKTFKMSGLMDSVKASRFTSTNFEEHSKAILRACFKKLASYDEFFPAYCATEYSTCGYLPLGSEFFAKVAKFMLQGFSQPMDEDLESSTVCCTREVLVNLQDRIRKELKFKKNIDTEVILRKLKIHLEIPQDRSPIQFDNAPELVLKCLE